MTAETTTLDTWAIVELMGHRKVAGRIALEAAAGDSTENP